MWWQIFFSDTEKYLSEYAQRFARLTKVECAFLLAHLPKGRILDMPSGHGRIALPLAEHGYIVHCVDYQKSFLERIPEHKNISKQQGDMREFCEPKKYDGSISLFTSFGYFGEPDDEKTLLNLIESTKTGGTVIIDVRNPYRHDSHEIETNAVGVFELYNYKPNWYTKYFKTIQLYGNYKSDPFGEDSPRMILVGTV